MRGNGVAASLPPSLFSVSEREGGGGDLINLSEGRPQKPSFKDDDRRAAEPLLLLLRTPQGPQVNFLPSFFSLQANNSLNFASLLPLWLRDGLLTPPRRRRRRAPKEEEEQGFHRGPPPHDSQQHISLDLLVQHREGFRESIVRPSALLANSALSQKRNYVRVMMEHQLTTRHFSLFVQTITHYRSCRSPADDYSAWEN